MNKGKQSTSPAIVRRIYVELLFGQYTYDLAYADDDVASTARVLLLYGDNGTGKTTIAQLLFHMLSRADGRGHRTFLAQTQFREFRVEFHNGAMLSAKRVGNEFIGPYKLTATTPSGSEKTVIVGTREEDGSVGPTNVDDKLLNEVLAAYAEPPLDCYYLSDNRLLQSDEFEEEVEDDWMGHRGQLITRRHGDYAQRIMVPQRTRSLVVEPSIWAETWMRRQAITASSVGEENISTIYTDIIRRVSQSDATDHQTTDQLPRLRSALHELAELSEGFVELGMVPKIPLGSLIESLNKAADAQKPLLASVVEPYVDSIRARLEALADIKVRLSTFLDIINAFYRRKSVEVTLRDGIKVLDDRGSALDPSVLSSGEKQLMLLLCNIMVATNQPTVFIIDEPELSLNVKWQRRLVDSLLQLIEGSPVQFVMATHSIELLTQHKGSVLRLEDRNVQGG